MKLPTRLIHNRKGNPERRTVNPPVERASTVLLPDRQSLYGGGTGYGRMGLSVHRELEAALCDLEGGTHARLTPSGLSACAVAIASAVEAGDHVLLSDSVYGPTRRFCEKRLPTMGISAARFNPRDPAALEAAITPSTKLIVLESPGSLTFEISDTPAIVAIAGRAGITTVMDNTWGAGVFHRPLDLGVDISVQALTKYIVGHADAFGGAVVTKNRKLAASVESLTEDWGISLGPDDAYAALRGTRTLNTRLKAHEASALEIAEWLGKQEDVSLVIHPALPNHPDHEVWKRDFSGSCGLFGFLLDAPDEVHIDAFLSALKLFKMGFSWGGFESLIIPSDEQLTRLPEDWSQARNGRLIRLHAGLEDTADLIDDLARAFSVLDNVKNT
ncbi:cystathionine beta-lyase [Henriciella barbarensis]|uniref:Cystathionine beta-lyase n=1 Tax=Henriciella barbarensis TaxID=86342 RepID=A0A399R9G5_9PROT|nr:cystathionine beta-lyase [Henriciella barbarensis]RIJ26149.1 cystathionine beta-lyase [Henriciella barbarensis]